MGSEMCIRDSSIMSDDNGAPHEARRVLVSLLRQGVILSSKKPKLYESLCHYQNVIRDRLNDLYLKLVLDEREGVAFISSQSEEEEEASDGDMVSLISRRTLSLYDTLLLLVLRKYYQEREKAGEQKVVIDLERTEHLLIPFLPLTNSTSQERGKLRTAMKKMDERYLLNTINESDGRYEITPIIRYVVSAEFLESVLKEYQRLADERGLVAFDSDGGQDE